MTDEELVESYKKAKYIVMLKHGNCRLRVGFPSPEIDEILNKYKTLTAYFITPENPFSQTLSEAENKLRHQRFLSALDEKQYTYVEGYGTDDKEIWSKEHSYLIFCDDAEAMQTLAANFGQKGMLRVSIKSPVSLLILDDMRYQEINYR